jgi:large subunit ribosomal protein L25
MYEVNVEVRDSKITKASTSELKRNDKIPAVMYGKNAETIHFAIPRKEVNQLIQKRGTSGLVKLNMEKGGKTESCEAVFKNLQFNSLRTKIVHLDFQKTEANTPVRIKVPLKPEGTPFGVLRQGGVLQQNAQESEIVCLPKDIPDYIAIDVSKLQLHEFIKAKDIEGFKFTVPEQSFFTVASSRAARVLEATATGDEAEEAEQE